MTETEAVALFKDIDHDENGTLTPEEIVLELSSVNTYLIL